MALGIPSKAIPVTNDGEKLIVNHLQWIDSRRRIEAGDYNNGAAIGTDCRIVEDDDTETTG